MYPLAWHAAEPSQPSAGQNTKGDLLEALRLCIFVTIEQSLYCRLPCKDAVIGYLRNSNE